jgi:MFS family permease
MLLGAVEMVWCLLAFFMDMAGGIVVLAIQILGVELNATDAQLGLIGAASPLGYAVSSLCNPRVSSVIGRERSALIGSVIYAVAALSLTLAYYTHSVFALMLISTACGIAIGFYWPAVQALMGTSAPHTKLLHFITVYNIAWSFGRTIGMRLSGILFMHSPYTPFVVGAFISFFIAVALMALQKESSHSECARTQGDEMARSSAEFDELVVASAQLGNLLRALTVGSIVALFPKWAKWMNLNPAQVSGLIFLLLAGHVISFIAAPMLYKWINPRMLIAIKATIIVGSTLVAISSRVWQFVLSFTFVGICAGLACTTSTYYSILSQGRTTRGSARHEATVGSGSVFGPLLGGWIAQLTLQPRSPYLLMALLGLCLLALDLCYLLRHRLRTR